jgi:two-component system sensor histidine kinase RegB
MDEERRAAEIALRTFVTARWVLLALVAVGWAVQLFSPAAFAKITSWFPPPPEPRGTATVMLALAALNVLLQRLVLARRRATLNIAGASLLIDATALTALLALSGGVGNAFTVMYFVPITLATQVTPRWTWALAAYCSLCFAGLFAWTPAAAHAHAHHDFNAHIRGMWVAFGISGLLITYFVHRIAISLALQRAELTHLRERAAQDRHLTAMGTLAAGAAHELGTPLGTISMLAADLETMEAHERGDAADAIREALARCKQILGKMASPELRIPALGAVVDTWPLAQLADELPPPPGLQLTVQRSPAFTAEAPRCAQPREVLGQILRELLANAAEACRRRPGARGVQIAFDLDGAEAQITITDDGVGMSPAEAAAAFDAFYSTKPEGQGMGLGLYLARAHLRQLGGALSLRSEPGGGTTVEMRFPLTHRPALNIPARPPPTA